MKEEATTDKTTNQKPHRMETPKKQTPLSHKAASGKSLQPWESMDNDQVQELADIVGRIRSKSDWNNWREAPLAYADGGRIIVPYCISIRYEDDHGSWHHAYSDGIIIRDDLPQAAVEWCIQNGIDYTGALDEPQEEGGSDD